jgi:tetratricopeptide (TPR) repeat protein
MRYLALTFTALALVSCNRDPNYLKQKNVQSGNKYFDAGRLNEASIMYRKAVGIDRKYGEAWYRLALTDLKRGQVASAVGSLRRAVELLKPGTVESNDATLKLGEIYVVGAQSQENNDQLVKEVSDLAAGLLKRNPDSWEGHKLTGDLALMDTAVKYKKGQGLEAKKALGGAIEEYRRSLTAKPGDYTITLALGRSLLLDGESAEAETLFRNLIARDKTNLAGYQELYRVLLQSRRLPEAEALLKNAIHDNPKEASLRLELARFYFGTNKMVDLIALLNNMKGDLKQFPQAYVQAGDFFVRVNQPDQALKQYEEGIRKDPGQKNVYLKHEIEVYVRANKLDLAYAKNNEILQNDPKDPEARGLKATFALDKGDITQAMTDLQSVVTSRPNNFVARFNLGRAHFARQEYEQARQEFEKAIQLRPDYIPARLALTQVSLLRGDTEAALHDADEILKISPGNIQGKIMKAAAFERQQKFDEARGMLTPVLEQNPNQVECLLELGVLDLNQKKNKEAIDLFRRAFEAAPNNIRGLLGESRAYLVDGQPDKSVDLIDVEWKKNPDRQDLLRELGNAQMAAGQFDNAIGSYQILMAKLKDPRQQADLWSRIAQAYRYKGDVQHSVEALEKSRQGMPDNPLIVTNLGMLYDELGKKDVAKKYYEMAIKLDQTNPYALNNLAYLITESNGDLNEALTYAQRAKQKLPNYTEISDTLGWIYIKKNLTDSAIDTFRTLVVQAPQNPTFHFHYAIALNQKGDRDNAKKECQAALANRPNKNQENEIRQLMTRIG